MNKDLRHLSLYFIFNLKIKYLLFDTILGIDFINKSSISPLISSQAKIEN
jgi:hypothetical protein